MKKKINRKMGFLSLGGVFLNIQETKRKYKRCKGLFSGK